MFNHPIAYIRKPLIIYDIEFSRISGLLFVSNNIVIFPLCDFKLRGYMNNENLTKCYSYTSITPCTAHCSMDEAQKKIMEARWKNNNVKKSVQIAYVTSAQTYLQYWSSIWLIDWECTTICLYNWMNLILSYMKEYHSYTRERARDLSSICTLK